MSSTRAGAGLLLLLLASGCRKEAPIDEPRDEPVVSVTTSTEFSVRIATVPERPVAGRQTRVSLTIATPSGSLPQLPPGAAGGIHVVAVNRDLTWYEHLHPRLNGETHETALTFPRDGEYVLHVIVRPSNASQFVRRQAITVGRGVEDAPRPLSVSPREAHSGVYTVRLGSDPEPPAAGIWNALTFSITRDGQPVTNLTPTGMSGHMIIVRQGGEDFVYAHSTDGEALSGIRGRAHLPALPKALDDHRRHKGDTGPEVTFHTIFPQIGRYKIWVEFLAGDEPVEAAFVVEVGKPKPPPPHQHP